VYPKKYPEFLGLHVPGLYFFQEKVIPCQYKAFLQAFCPFLGYHFGEQLVVLVALGLFALSL